MTDSSRTNQELAEENALLKQKIHALEKSRAGCKQINEALRESENWLQTIIEGTHALLLSVDINGYFTYVNDATARAVAYTNSEELIGKSYLHFVHLEDRQKVLDTFINQVNTLQQSSMQEFRITDTNGKVKWISLLSSLTIKEGQVVGQIGVAQDISERKQAEQINRMLFAIANAVNSNEDLNELYKRIRLILGNIIDVTNFFIAIIDRSKRTVSFPYHVDTVDEDFSPFNGDDTESTLTGLIVAEKKAFLLRKDELLERNSRNGIRGPLPLIWMGSPLLIREEVIGVVAVQSYTDADVYDEADLRLLTAVSQQIAVAIDRKRFLDNLQESEERLNFLVKNSSDILVIINADGSQRYSSPAAERITGFAMAELESRTIDTLVHPDDMDVVKKAWDEAVKHPEKTVTVQFRHVHKTRGWIYSEAVAQSFLAEPATNGVIANVRDITEHKRVERFLKEVITKNPMSIQILDKEGLTLEVNHSYKSLFGSVPPSGYSIFSDPQLLQMGMGKIFDQLRNGASVRFPDTYFNAHDSLSEFPDVPAWIRTLGFPLNDNNEKPERFVLMHENITERKQAEEALRESEETFRNIVQASPMGIHLYQLQNDGRLVFVGTNPAADKLLGVDNTRFIGMTIEEAFPPLQHTEIPSRYRRAAQLGESWHTEQIDYDHDKIVGAFEVYAFQMSLGKVAVLFNDITERKLAEEERERLQMQLTQAQKMEAIGQLAGGVAHDFNNMLGVIIGYSELILEQVSPSQQFHAELEEIQKAAHRSADLTRQLLTFARKQTVAPKVLDLNQTVEGMLNMLRRLIGENINLNWMPGNGLWPIKMDPSQIDQIMANLCVNARDAIAGVGKITVETENIPFDKEYCTTHAGSIPGEYVRIAVSDTGKGMDRETLAHIFEPFFTTKGVGEGTGLGLATAYGAVKQNNGFIKASSEPGRGTTFAIYLPRYTDKVKPAARTVAGDSISPGTETILLVEDEPMILKMTTHMLVGQGYRVLAAASPMEAIRLAKEHAGSIDLLMTDVIMPEMNGRDLAKHLLTISPHIKRLFMSGYTANVIEAHGILDEGVHFIQKPFGLKDLVAVIMKALKS